MIAWAVSSIALAIPWKFAVMADSNVVGGDVSGGTANNLGLLVDDLKNQSIDFVIFPGDMAEEPSHDNLDETLGLWKSQMKPLYDAGIYVYTIRGNHDISHSNSDPYLDLFPLARSATSPDGGYTYVFTHKNAKFIGFDQYVDRKASFKSHQYSLHSNQGQMMNRWVVAQINSSISPLNFAYAHEQLFPSKSHPDCMANDPDSRDALIAALGTHHGAYLCGHDHMYLRGTASDGHGHTAPELVVGTAGASNYNYKSINATGYTGPDTFNVDKVYGNSTKPYFGYLLVTVYDNNTWTGEFRGFQYDTYPEGVSHRTGSIQTMDAFNTIQEANGSQVVEHDSYGDLNKPLKVTPESSHYAIKHASFGDNIRSLGEFIIKQITLMWEGVRGSHPPHVNTGSSRFSILAFAGQQSVYETSKSAAFSHDSGVFVQEVH